MFAGATTVVLSAIDFPNGGGGFKGRTAAGELSRARPRSDGPALGDGRHRVLPLHRRRLRAPVPARAAARLRQARARVGGDPRERACGARRRSQHHPLQALGVRARVVHDRRRGLPARSSGRRAARDHLPDPGLAHPGRNGADRRHLQPLGRGHRRLLQPARAVHLPGAVGREPELPPDHLRRRPAAGAADGARRACGPGPEGPREARPAGRAAASASRRPRTKKAPRDRGRGPHRPLRRRHPDRRHERRLSRAGPAA